ncbi:MAG TPA: alanine--tRNA ligase-related protein, partial [Candidatus Paceibacterota bacterium]
GVPKDKESKSIWNELGVKDVREEGIEDVFWGPTGNEGPCGSTTEIYCKNASGKDVEIWNIVFNQFFYPGSREELLAETPGKVLKPLETPGVDTGMGLERLVMIAQNAKNIFETDLFQLIIDLLPAELDTSKKRIIADHVRAISFLISDGVRPSNKGASYILRRLMRRLIVASQGMEMKNIFETIVKNYSGAYPELNIQNILSVFGEEKDRFEKILKEGEREIAKSDSIDVKLAFKFYESYGLPYEVIKDLAGDKVKDLKRADFEREFAHHQEISRAGQEKKFGGHGLILNTGELKAANEEELKKVTRLHTATHLLQAALRKVLGPEVKQMGSDITAERTRFDFTFPRKLIDEEIKRVEDEVNGAIRRALPMQMKKMKIDEAKQTGALYFFRDKYPNEVNIYFAGNSLEDAFSKEFCGGPHVKNTSEIGEFKIVKEEASSAGVRRIRADVV